MLYSALNFVLAVHELDFVDVVKYFIGMLHSALHNRFCFSCV